MDGNEYCINTNPTDRAIIPWKELFKSAFGFLKIYQLKLNQNYPFSTQAKILIKVVLFDLYSWINIDIVQLLHKTLDLKWTWRSS